MAVKHPQDASESLNEGPSHSLVPVVQAGSADAKWAHRNEGEKRLMAIGTISVAAWNVTLSFSGPHFHHLENRDEHSGTQSDCICSLVQPRECALAHRM